MSTRGGDSRRRPVNADRVEEVIGALDRGETRVAEPDGDDWRVNPEAQEAILEYFRLREMEPQEVGPFEYHDKIPLKHDYEKLGVRVVPPAVARYGAFVGSRCILTEGVRVGAGAVLGPNVSLTASVPIIDVTGSSPVEHRAYVPPRAVVVPGTRPRDFPAGTYHLACALIIGWRSESTDLKVSLNDALREHGLGA